MDPRKLIRWIDDQISVDRNALSRTTDLITVSHLTGKIQAWEAVQVKITMMEFDKEDSNGQD